MFRRVFAAHMSAKEGDERVLGNCKCNGRWRAIFHLVLRYRMGIEGVGDIWE